MKLQYGEQAAREVSERIAAPVATLAALIAIPADRRVDGMIVTCLADGSKWRFNATSTASDASGNLVQTPSAGSGRWIRHDSLVDLVLPFTFNTADATALFTCPAGFRLRLIGAIWEVTADFTGGASSAIGLSTNVTGATTKGDLLGGATGDVAAGLTAAGGFQGTLGAKIATPTQLVMKPTSTVKFDRITSAFTAGTGNAHVQAAVIVGTG